LHVGVLRPLLPSLDAASSAIGRDAEVNEVIKGVIIVFKIIFNGLRCLRCLRRWLRCLRCLRCLRRGGLHVCVLLAVCCVDVLAFE